jgi:hypothetical protein
LGELFKTFLIHEIDNMPRRYNSIASEKLYTKDEQKKNLENVYDTLNCFLTETYSPCLYGKCALTKFDG